ncbi:hypothetical protein Goari_018537 [Gossypium aridum]|uniref:Uncharacterized protein n=1 Tax=Gossypium aridum TaxID=34290 RepID=A0A7J8WQ37_GOSAI|nr:hypothetical protein [Gossypium aridum]
MLRGLKLVMNSIGGVSCVLLGFTITFREE